MQFAEPIDDLLDGRALALALLVELDIASAPERLWAGVGPLTVGAQTWQGTGGLLEISGLESTQGTAASPFQIKLTATPKIVSDVLDAEAQIVGRRCTVFVQFFSIAKADAADWSTVGTPQALQVGFMQPPTIEASGPDLRAVTIPCEGLWTRRKRPPAGLWTDGDQKVRFPGDRGLESVAGLANRTITGWP